MTIYNLLSSKWKTINSNYNIHNGDYLFVDSTLSDSTGSLILNFPNNPKKGDYFIIKDVNSIFDKHPIIFNSNQIPLYLDSSSNPVLNIVIKIKGFDNQILYNGSSWQFKNSIIETPASAGDDQHVWQSFLSTLIKKKDGTYVFIYLDMQTGGKVVLPFSFSYEISKLYEAGYGYVVKTKDGQLLYFGTDMSSFATIMPSAAVNVTSQYAPYSHIPEDLTGYGVLCMIMKSQKDINDLLISMNECKIVLSMNFDEYQAIGIKDDDLIYKFTCIDNVRIADNMTITSPASLSKLSPVHSKNILAVDADNNMYKSADALNLNFIPLNVKVSQFRKDIIMFKLVSGEVYIISDNGSYLCKGWPTATFNGDTAYVLPSTLVTSDYSAFVYNFSAIDADGFLWQSGYGYATHPELPVVSEAVTLAKTSLNINN